MSLFYSATTARARHSSQVMTASQKEQLHKNYKKYAIQIFKERSKTTVFDGSGLFRPKKLKIYFHEWQSSDILRSSTLGKKVATFYEYSDDDKKKIATKTATELRKAGYKVDVEAGGGLLLYKPAKKR
ncbi:TPA: hypothetical protein ACGO5Q_001060 [Streptococcus suis]